MNKKLITNHSFSQKIKMFSTKNKNKNSGKLEIIPRFSTLNNYTKTRKQIKKQRITLLLKGKEKLIDKVFDFINYFTFTVFFYFIFVRFATTIRIERGKEL